MRNLKELTNLPFVGKPSASGRSFWTVPAVGEFGDGVQVATTMANAYVEYLSSSGADLPPILPQIVIDMLGVEVDDAKRGQLVGFLSAIEMSLRQPR